VFVGSQRLLFGEIILPERPQQNRLVWGFFNYFENNCPENVRNQAQSYLLRVVALTNAIEVGDGCYRLYACTRVQAHSMCAIDMSLGFEKGKTPNPVTSRRAFFVPKQLMPSAEKIAIALLMLKNDPTLFDKWAV
jgi:hypothetical protein